MKNNLKANAQKFASWLGIVGASSCYLAMFPLSVVAILGIVGISATGILFALNTYMVSVLFQPVLFLSLALLVIGAIPWGLIPTTLALLAGLLIYLSMNIYIKAWLFLLAFLLLALAPLVGEYNTKGFITRKNIVISSLPFVIISLILIAATYSSGQAVMMSLP